MCGYVLGAPVRAALRLTLVHHGGVSCHASVVHVLVAPNTHTHTHTHTHSSYVPLPPSHTHTQDGRTAISEETVQAVTATHA